MNTGYPPRFDLDAIHRSLLAVFPPLTDRAQQTSVALYRLLIEGRSVKRERLAAVLGLPMREVAATLDEPGMRSELLYDNDGRIIGFCGLGTEATPHRLEIYGRRLFTWCAWDALFIPELLGAPARLSSRCPATGETVQLLLTDRGVKSDGEPVLTFVLPNRDHCARSTERSIDCFCQQVNVFGSAETAAHWAVSRDGVFVLPLGEAFELARRHLAERFNAVRAKDGFARTPIGA